MTTCNICFKDKPREEFNKNGSYKGRPKFKPMCKSCEYSKKVERFKDIAISVYGSLSCSSCGYDKCFAAIDFHHRNPSEKEISPCTLLFRSEKVIREELHKCDILCANCHREVHHMV